MNFIEAVKLLELDKNIKLMRRSKSFKITSDNIGIFLIAEGIFLKGEVYVNNPFSASIEEILAEDWYVVKDEKLHSFEQALKALKEGKTIKRKSSAVEFYHDYTPNTIGSNSKYTPEKYDGNKWVDMSFTNNDILANDWTILDKEVTK